MPRSRAVAGSRAGAVAAGLNGEGEARGGGGAGQRDVHCVDGGAGEDGGGHVGRVGGGRAGVGVGGVARAPARVLGLQSQLSIPHTNTACLLTYSGQKAGSYFDPLFLLFSSIV